MHQPVKSLSLITLTVLISLVSPVSLKGTSLKISEVPAQAQTTQNRKAEADRLLMQGIKQQGAGQLEAALQSLQQALTIYKELQDRSGEGQILKNLGNLYYAQKDYKKAIEFQQKALVLAKEIRDRDLEGRALNNLGAAYKELGDSAKAIEYYQQAFTIAKELQDRSGEGQVLKNLGDAYYAQKDYKKAIEFQQQALAIAREIRDRELEGRALNNLGLAYKELGDSNKAIEYYQQALVIAQEIQNRQLEQIALNNLGFIYTALKNPAKAVEYYQQILGIARKINNRKLESMALSAIGVAYWSLRDYQKANEYHQQALAISRELKDRDSELSTLYELIANYFYLGNYQKMMELSQQQLTLAQEIKNHGYEGYALANLGFAYYAMGDFQKIIDFGQQALTVGRESKNPDAEFFGLLALSVGYANLGNNEKALEFSQASLAITRDPKRREQIATNAEWLALNTMVSLYRKLGRKEQAITVYREALTIDESGFNAQVGLARIYRELNMPATSITYYKQAVSNLEQIRGKLPGLDRQLQESFLQAIVVGAEKTKNADIYRELADFLLSQGRILEAQQVLELLKVQELRDYTKDTRAGGKNSEVALNQTEEQIKKENGTLIAFGQRLYECQQTRCNQLSQLLDQREALTEQFNQKVQTIEKQVRDRRSKDNAFFDPNKQAKAKEIVEAQPGTVLIYPLVLEDKIWLLWASKGGIIKSVEVPKVGQQQLAQTVLKFRQLLQTPNSKIAELQATGKQLYDWLIKPLEPELKANKIQNLVFSLDRAARYIPMSALFDGKNYLIENYAVSTVLSADLTNTSDRIPPGTQNTSVLALGLSNPVSGFNALPNVPAELDAIVRKQPNDTKGIYPGLEFLNKDFDWRSLRDNLLGHKLLHIATHGEFVPGSPDASYLLLGTGEKLAIPKITTLQDLGNVSLVVLSACQTALGEPGQDGNEINGISYYFLNAGAKAVMASLWKVDDDSTSQLMQNFYGNLAKGTANAPITKAEALRHAQLNLLRGNSSTTDNFEQRSSLGAIPRIDSQTSSTNSSVSEFSHPYYWAPFVLIGNSL